MAQEYSGFADELLVTDVTLHSDYEALHRDVIGTTHFLCAFLAGQRSSV